MTDPSEPDPRRQVIAVARALITEGLVRGTAGNVSVRDGDGCWITPTGLAADRLEPDDVVFLGWDGRTRGRRAPSSEWRFHRDVYRARPDVGAVVHAHPPFGVALACGHRSVPPFHYMIARFGGNDVRCAPYARFGTQELSDAVLAALRDRSGCLLANHGTLVCGGDADQALALAVELEQLCEQYWRTCQLGEPVLLTDAQMAEAHAAFAAYGQPSP